LKQEAVVAQAKRRKEMWREKMIENEGSEQSNEWRSCRKETQREAQKKMER